MTPWAYGTPTTPPIGFVLIPSGKHAAFRDWDAPSDAKCSCADARWCARYLEVEYAAKHAKHRADVTQ